MGFGLLKPIGLFPQDLRLHLKSKEKLVTTKKVGRQKVLGYTILGK